MIAGWIVAAVLLAGCEVRTDPAPQPDATNQPTPAPAPAPRDGPPSLPVPKPPLDREALLVATFRAASAAAAGQDDRAEQASLGRQRFVFRFRFGCGGATPADAPRGWTYRDGSLRLFFSPASAALFPAMAPVEEDRAEALAAFLVEQPWLLVPACGPANPPVTPGGQVALVQYFSEEDSRTTRPPETYRAVKPMAEDALPAEGLELALEGRLEPAADGRVIRCAAASPELRPDCAIRMRIDAVRVQDPRDGSLLSEWSAG